MLGLFSTAYSYYNHWWYREATLILLFTVVSWCSLPDKLLLSSKNKRMSDDAHDEDVVSTPEPRPSAQTSPSEIMETTQAWAKVARAFIYVEVASLVLMFATLGVWNSADPYTAYSLSVAVISLGLCLIIQTGEFLQPG